MQNPLLTLASSPALAVSARAPVREAVARMVERHLGAIAVMDDDGLKGIFTERDLMEKVVHPGLDPAHTPVGEVMTDHPICVNPAASRAEALQVMLEHRFRHLPITNAEQQPIAMLSFRDLLAHQVIRLREEVDSLVCYLAADGPGG